MPRPTLQYAVLRTQETTVISLSRAHKSNHKTPCSHPASCYFICPTVTKGALFKCVSLSVTSIGYFCGGEFMFHDERKTVRSNLIYPLKRAISTKSCYIRSLHNVFLSHLATDFSIIFFSRKVSFHWTKETTVMPFCNHVAFLKWPMHLEQSKIYLPQLSNA